MWVSGKLDSTEASQGLGRMEEGEVSSSSLSQQLGFNLCLTLALLAKVFFEERLPSLTVQLEPAAIGGPSSAGPTELSSSSQGLEQRPDR